MWAAIDAASEMPVSGHGALTKSAYQSVFRLAAQTGIGEPRSQCVNAVLGRHARIVDDTAKQQMTPEDLAALKRAVETLEHPSFAARLANMVGKPVELIEHALPPFAAGAIAAATKKGLEAAMQVALRTLQRDPYAGSQALHKILATASGAAGGAFGLATLPIELPISTIIILRSIMDIAKSEGEDLSDPEAVLSCMQVFAIGGRASSDDASESGYLAVRGALAKSVTSAARFISDHGVTKEGGPALVRFITQVASRFGFVVTEKVAVQAVPIIGAVSGAIINYTFIAHFQGIARGHFTVRRLERLYGKEVVDAEYSRLSRSS
jgi:EcsC protein family